MSIFGDMDEEEIDQLPDDPWEIKDDWYFVSITKAWEVQEEDGEERYWLRLTMSVEEPDNDYHGMPVRLRFQIFPREDSETVEQYKQRMKHLSGDDKRDIARLKQFCQQGLDLKPAEMVSFVTSDFIGYKLHVQVKNRKSNKEGDTRKFPNVVDFLSERLYEERGLKKDEASESLGF